MSFSTTLKPIYLQIYNQRQEIGFYLLLIFSKLKIFAIQVGSEEHLSYYSVFDGHAGTDAACYAASHLHELLVASQYYPEDPVQVDIAAQ